MLGKTIFSKKIERVKRILDETLSWESKNEAYGEAKGAYCLEVSKDAIKAEGNFMLIPDQLLTEAEVL